MAKMAPFSCISISITVIEHLPAELRDRFTEMREMDLSVQSQKNCTFYAIIRIII